MDKTDEDSGVSGTRIDQDLAGSLASARADADKAQTYLEEATRLVRLQIEQLKDARLFEHFGHFSAAMKAAFEAVVAAIALAVLIALCAAVWSAAHSDGLVIEPFSVPSDMAARGLTGQVVAARLLDRLAQLQAQTISNRPASSYANNWGDDIKVEIPETGVSIGQFYDYLCRWLGHQTRISGEVWRDASGRLSMTARTGGQTGATATGPESDLDALMRKTAESIYHATQPYRYAVYLMNVNRTEEAETVYRALIAHGSKLDRAWAYIGIENIYQARGDIAQAQAMLRRALEVRPGFVMAYTNRAALDAQIGHAESSLAAQRKTVDILERGDAADIAASVRALDLAVAQAALTSALGDFAGQIAANRRVEAQPEFGGAVENARAGDVFAYASLHDRAAYERAYAALPPTKNPQVLLNRDANHVLGALAFGDWRPTLAARARFVAVLKPLGRAGALADARQLRPFVAYALALSGDMDAAHGQIDGTPADCDICLRMHARIDALEKNWNGAGYWFARAVAFSPSSPFAYAEWGQMLFDKGDLDGAIAKFREAHEKGPHFADPLVGWGEALIVKNRSDLALAKFEEANKCAPNWGRLHLKWGEALMWTGDKAGAQKQFAVAASLDLTSSEKSELVAQRKKTGQ